MSVLSTSLPEILLERVESDRLQDLSAKSQPKGGIEPPTHALRMRCSTPELLRRLPRYGDGGPRNVTECDLVSIGAIFWSWLRYRVTIALEKEKNVVTESHLAANLLGNV